MRWRGATGAGHARDRPEASPPRLLCEAMERRRLLLRRACGRPRAVASGFGRMLASKVMISIARPSPCTLPWNAVCGALTPRIGSHCPVHSGSDPGAVGWWYRISGAGSAAKSRCRSRDPAAALCPEVRSAGRTTRWIKSQNPVHSGGDPGALGRLRRVSGAESPAKSRCRLRSPAPALCPGVRSGGRSTRWIKTQNPVHLGGDPGALGRLRRVSAAGSAEKLLCRSRNPAAAQCPVVHAQAMGLNRQARAAMDRRDG